MSGKYYPNNWEAIQKTSDKLFKTCTWEEFYEWVICGWRLSDSVSCILRVENTRTGKIKEHKYRQTKEAYNRLMKYSQEGDYNVTVCNAGYIYLIKKDTIDEPDYD